jgi:hypothetical protein
MSIPPIDLRQADGFSDGKSPEEISKQIMAIIPVVTGQTLDRRFSIPSRKSTQSVTQLNDFNTSQKSAEEEPSKPALKTTDEGVEADDVVNHMAKLNVKSDPQPKASNADLIRRHDSQTDEIDEFHDARS